MKIKTSEITGAALDRAVVTALGYTIDENQNAVEDGVAEFAIDCFNPSEVWAQGGPIIEREGIEVRGKVPNCYASYPKHPTYHGPTPLIAAMRCYCASKLGDEVEIPEELK